MRIAKAVIVVLLMTGVVQAQEKTASPNADPLAALTAEVRLLRLATEKASQTQTLVQALAVYLTVQQSRLVHVSGRLDAVRTDLFSATNTTRGIIDRLSEQEPKSLQLQNTTQENQARMAADFLKRQLSAASAREAELRARESEVAAELQTELNRWTDLTSRLEQIIKQ
jgi:hypothetical protein